VTNLLGAFAERLLAGQGATAIAVGDPSATGEFSPVMFEKFAVRYLNQLADRVHALVFRSSPHLRRSESVWHLLPQLRSDALSTDAMVSLPVLKEKFPAITTMGKSARRARMERVGKNPRHDPQSGEARRQHHLARVRPQHVHEAGNHPRHDDEVKNGQ